MSEILLTLSTRPAQAEAITDWLLEENLPGFSSWLAWGHSNRNEQLTLAEQVQGKQKRVMIGLHLPQEQAEQMLQKLRNQFSHYDVHYWLQPLLDFGRL